MSFSRRQNTVKYVAADHGTRPNFTTARNVQPGVTKDSLSWDLQPDFATAPVFGTAKKQFAFVSSHSNFSFKHFHPIFYFLPAQACPRLTRPEHGTIQPPHCVTDKVLPGERCILHCAPGFKPAGKRTAFCDTNQLWSPSDDLRCVPIPTTTTPEPPIQPTIVCPPDAIEMMAPGQQSKLIKLQKPETNVDWERYIDSQPLWAKKLEVELTPGVYPIVYRARSPNSQLHEICRTMLTVKESQAPRVMSCPESIEVQLEPSELSRPIHWAEPRFESPNHLKEVYKNRIPGAKFKPGVHQIEYVAVDMEGLEAKCQFTITVKGGKVRPVVIPQLNRKQILGVNRAPPPTKPPPTPQAQTLSNDVRQQVTATTSNDQQYLLCPSKPPVKVEPGFPVSKIRIYFPSLLTASTATPSSPPPPEIAPLINISNHSPGPSETPANTVVASSSSTSSNHESDSSVSVNVTTTTTTTTTDANSYENFIEILFHLPSYQINSSSS